MAKKKIKTIDPSDIHTGAENCPRAVIECRPRLMRYVGIGFVDEGEASAEDLRKYPVVLHPWVNPKGLG